MLSKEIEILALWDSFVVDRRLECFLAQQRLDDMGGYNFPEYNNLRHFLPLPPTSWMFDPKKKAGKKAS